MNIAERSNACGKSSTTTAYVSMTCSSRQLGTVNRHTRKKTTDARAALGFAAENPLRQSGHI
jgi:hypothetical protein